MAKARKIPAGTKATINAVEFGYITEIDLPERGVSLVDVTTMEDTAVVNYTSFPPDYGTLKVSGFYDPEETADKDIEALIDADNPADVTVVVSIRKAKVSGSWTFSTRTYVGRITKHKIDPLKYNEGIKCSFEIKVNAKPTNG
jgi:hypothetical protein